MYVGQSLPLPDAVERVNGSAPFLINSIMPGMLFGSVLRSPFPHARIVRVDATAAEAHPGVVAVLTRADFASESPLDPFYGSVLKDHQILAIDKARYVGEPVAAVAALDAETAEEVLELIEVEYEELPAALNLEQALKSGAPLVHEGVVKRYPGPSRISVNGVENSNIFQHVQVRYGDVEAGFQQADRVFEHTFHSPSVHHAALEPHVAIAQVRDGEVTIWTATQAPYTVRRRMAGIFGVEPERIRIVAGLVGGGFGAKSHVKIEPLAAALAWKAGGRPVKLTLSRTECFTQITKHAADVTLRTGVSTDGRLIARQASIYWDAGAYSDTSPIVAKNGAITCYGPYRLQHAWADSYGVYTNSPPAGSYRAPAVLEVTWAGESQMDMIAAELGIDPLTFRLQNVLEDGDTFITGETMHDLHYKELLQATAERIGWNEPPSSRPSFKRGRGFAVTIKSTTTPSTSKADIRLDPDGSCTLLVSTVELGQGSSGVLRQIAADALGVSIESLHLATPDTTVTPFDMATNSSRSTFSMGNALRLAANDLKEKIRGLAAMRLELEPGTVVLEEGYVQAPGAPSSRMSWGDLLQWAGMKSLVGTGDFTTKGGLDPETYRGVASVHWHQGVGAAEVEVDSETGQIRVTDFHAATFAGKVVNPTTAALQTEGNVIMGLGVALSEELIYDGGQLVNANLGDYLIPSILDVPSTLSSSEMESQDEHGDLHGVAESTIPTVAPAIANAVADATGVRVTSLPLKAEQVLARLKAAS